VSKERQKARAEREAARRAELEAAARRRGRAARRKALVPSVALPRRRRPRRYGALTARQRYEVVAAFVVAQAVVWFLFESLRVRLTLAVLTVAVLLVLVITRRSTPR
jgi:Flp pilus assembly protein TadB